MTSLKNGATIMSKEEELQKWLEYLEIVKLHNEKWCLIFVKYHDTAIALRDMGYTVMNTQEIWLDDTITYKVSGGDLG
jgi:hypothetical protein